ncbi:hypothetical protein HLB23_08410 [Nocardia uniformis]|uniref:DUF6542 domain-containing protein n=1 Tax=Nocardia uniformis TaxID=53432 RepID=A0A849BUM9_9NOCA|nr:hypothetical protein [Nocardia uniformis]
MPPSHSSILPSVPGVPAGAAVLIAVTCTFLGFFIDAAGGSELTGTFSSLYVLGCVLSVLVVRFRGLFTALVLPPLLLFFAVPLAYQQMLGNASSLRLKDMIFNLAIPLVNRFPVMALATVLVLAIGGARIYLHRREADPGNARSRTPRSRSARPNSNAVRSRRTRPADTEPAKRRFRAKPAGDDEFDDRTPAPAPRGRRPNGRVAERPPRVGAERPSSGTPADRKRAAAKPPTGDRKPTAAGRKGPASDRKPPVAEKKAAAADRTPPVNGRKPRTDRVPPTDQPRRRGQTGEVPPHPRPNVRYRDRDSGRIER